MTLMTPTNRTAIDYAGKSVTCIVSCCKLTLRDRTVMGFTSSTEQIVIDGIEYKPTTLLSLSTIETNDDFSVDNLDIGGILNGELNIMEHDIQAGRYDYAEVEVFTVHHNDPASKVIQRRGWLGEVEIHNGRFCAEVRGMTQKLQCNVGNFYSPTCRATFGDNACRVSLQRYTYSGVVDQVDPVAHRQIFTARMFNPDGYFSLGEIVWRTGDNKDLRMEIKEHSGSRFVLVLAMPRSIKSEDKFRIVAGCDKEFTTCCNKFSNGINFRGEPHVPGKNWLNTTPNTV